MVTIAQVQRGAAAFVDQELTAGMEGLAKFGVQTIAGVYIAKLDTLAQQWAAHPMVAPLGIIKDGYIDIDVLYNEAAKHMSDPLPVQTPIGTWHFTKDDLAKLCDMIKRA